MSFTDGRTRTKAAFNSFYTAKNTKAKAKSMGAQGTRAHEPGKNTYEIRERHLRHLQDVLERDEVTHIGMVTQEQIDIAFEECVDSMIPRAAEVVSPNTVRNVVTSFKSFIKWQVERGAIQQARLGWLLENLPTIDKYNRKMLIVKGPEWPDIFKIAHKRHIMDRVVIELAFYLAQRISEARTVRWMDLDLEEDSVQFFRDKRSDYLKLPVPPDLKATLLEVRAWLTDEGMPPEPSWPIVLARQTCERGPGAKVAPHWKCKPGVAMDPNTVRRAMRETLLVYGITPMQMICQGMHIARRSRACHLYREGVDIRVVAKILGHKTFLTTLDYIRDGLDEEEIKAAMTLPLRSQEVELHTGGGGGSFSGNTPAVPQDKNVQAQAVLTLINSGSISEAEAAILLTRMIQ